MLLLLSGPSGIGKDSTWKRVAKEMGFNPIVPYTTRSPRDHEIDGTDYRFVSIDEFHHMIKDDSLLEWDYTLGNYYGIGLEAHTAIQDDEQLVLQVLGRMAIRLRSRFRNAHALLLLPSKSDTLRDRLRERGYSQNELDRRIQHGLEEAAHAPLFDQVVTKAECMDRVNVTCILGRLLRRSSSLCLSEKGGTTNSFPHKWP